MSATAPNAQAILECIPLGRGTIPIPIKLLQAHEEGKVIFFCGAGVSRKAGLPDAPQLLQRVRDSLEGKQGGQNAAAACSVSECCQCKAPEQPPEEEYERLEQAGGLVCCGNENVCECVRCRVAKALKFTQNEDLQAHTDLLKLGSWRPAQPNVALQPVSPTYRLVTTNFDLCFLEAERRLGGPCRSFIAPLLPQPKAKSLAGVVYLHGRIGATSSCDRDGGETLVLTSGDYGRAYITERWASRFVSELLRSFTVCFVGYSFGDTVMRYLRDAASTEVGTDGGFKQAYIFVQTKEAANHRTSAIKPIYFENKGGKFAELHETLKLWAARSSQGRYGRPAIIDELSGSTPDNRLPEDEARLKWALGAVETANVLAESASAAARDGAGTLSVSWMRVISKRREGEPIFFAPRLPESAAAQEGTYPGLARWFASQAHLPEAISWFCESQGPMDERLREAIETADWFVSQGSDGVVSRDAAMRFWQLAMAGRSEREIATVRVFDARSMAGALLSTAWLWDRRLEPRIHLSAGAAVVRQRAVHLADLRDWLVVLADREVAEHFRQALRVTDLGRERIPAFSFERAERLLALIDDAIALWSQIGFEPWQISDWLEELDSDSPTLRDANEWLILPLLLDHMLQRAATAPAEAKRWIRSALPVKPSWVRDWLLLRAAAVPALVTNGDWINWVSQDGGRRARDPNLRRAMRRLEAQRWSDDLSRKMKERLAGVFPFVTEGLPSGFELRVPNLDSTAKATNWLLNSAADVVGSGEVFRTVSANAGLVSRAVCELAVPNTACTTEVLGEVLEALSAVALGADDLAALVKIIPRLPPEEARSLAREAALLLSKAVREGVDAPAALVDALDFVSRFAADTKTPQGDYLTFAVNQAAGIAAEARLRLWMRGATAALGSVPDDLRRQVVRALQEADQLSAAVILGGYANHLYVAERAWTSDVLLGAMKSRERHACAQALWIGYVRAGRLYPPVLEVLAPAFRAAQVWVRADQEAARRFASMCTLAAADDLCGLPLEEWRGIFSSFSGDELVASAFQVARIVEAAGGRAVALWAKDGAATRVLSLWPERKLEDSRKAESIAMALVKPLLEQPASLVYALPLVEPWLCALPKHGVGIDEKLVSWIKEQAGSRTTLAAMRKLLSRVFSSDKSQWPVLGEELLKVVDRSLEQLPNRSEP